MSKFLYKCSFFVVILFVVWLGFELFYRIVPNNYTVKDENVKKAYNNAEALIFGNSHAFYGLNPEYFSGKAFNISNVSQTLFHDKLLFDKHSGHFKNLKYVILCVEYTSLSQTQEYVELKWRNYFYEAQMGLETGLISPFDIKKYSLALVPRFSLSINSLQEYIKNGTLAECSAQGFGSLYNVHEANNSPEVAEVVVQKHEDGSMDFDENIKRIDVIIKKCSEKGIDVILVNMPVTAYYSKLVNTQKRNKIISVCKDEALKENVHYIDLFQDSRFETADFYDADHLNVKGAEKCSKILNSYIESLN